jgi:hypothetical protein
MSSRRPERAPAQLLGQCAHPSPVGHRVGPPEFFWDKERLLEEEVLNSGWRRGLPSGRRIRLGLGASGLRLSNQQYLGKRTQAMLWIISRRHDGAQNGWQLFIGPHNFLFHGTLLHSARLELATKVHTLRKL